MKIKLILMSLLLTACTTMPVPVEQKKPELIWPEPVSEYTGQWDVKEIDSKIFVGMEYNEFQMYRIWSNDVLRYVKDLKSMVCYYQPQDLRCNNDQYIQEPERK